MNYFLATDGTDWFLLPENLRETWDKIGNHLHRQYVRSGKLIDNCRIKCDISNISFQNPVEL